MPSFSAPDAACSRSGWAMQAATKSFISALAGDLSAMSSTAGCSGDRARKVTPKMVSMRVVKVSMRVSVP